MSGGMRDFGLFVPGNRTAENLFRWALRERAAFRAQSDLAGHPDGGYNMPTGGDKTGTASVVRWMAP